MSDLNKGVIRQWIAALRSGEFKQTQGRLGEVAEDGSNAYCCLGVLCELAMAEGLVRHQEKNFEWAYDGETMLPPTAVAHFIGDPEYTYEVSIHDDEFDSDRIELSSLNDDHAWTFEQIADVLEDNYLTGVPVE